MVQILTANGLNPFAENNHGETPMHIAVIRSNVGLFRHLFFLFVKSPEHSDEILQDLRCYAQDDMWVDVCAVADEYKAIWRMCNEAVTMGQHQRLGKLSWIKILPPEVLQMILDQT